MDKYKRKTPLNGGVITIKTLVLSEEFFFGPNRFEPIHFLGSHSKKFLIFVAQSLFF